MAYQTIKCIQNIFYNIEESSSIERANTLANDLIRDQERLQTEIQTKYGDKIKTIEYWENFNSSLGEYIGVLESKLNDLKYRYDQLSLQTLEKDLPILLEMQDQIYDLELEILLSKQNLEAKSKDVVELTKYLYKQPSRLTRLKNTLKYSLKEPSQISFENGDVVYKTEYALNSEELHANFRKNLLGIFVFFLTGMGEIAGTVIKEGSPDYAIMASILMVGATAGNSLYGSSIKKLIDKKSLPLRNNSTDNDLDFRLNKKILPNDVLREKLRIQKAMSEQAEVFYENLNSISRNNWEVNHKKGRIDYLKEQLKITTNDLIKAIGNSSQNTIDLYKSRVEDYQEQLTQVQGELDKLHKAQKTSYQLAKDGISNLEASARRMGLQIPLKYHAQSYKEQKDKAWEKQFED